MNTTQKRYDNLEELISAIQMIFLSKKLRLGFNT